MKDLPDSNLTMTPLKVASLASRSLTQVLEVDPDLVHAAGEGPAEHDRRLAVEAEALELRAALLAARRHLAHADLVAHHLDRFLAVDHAPVRNGIVIGVNQQKYYNINNVDMIDC